MTDRVSPIQSRRGLPFLPAGESVLVLDKLASLLALRRKTPPGATHDGHERERQTVLEMMQESTLSPIDGIKQWGLSHVEYFIDARNETAVIIRHAHLGSRLPQIFSNLHEAQVAMAKLLLGQIIEGEGDYVYLGQPLVNCHGLAASLPHQPKQSTHFTAGFSPVSSNLLH